MLSRMRFSAFCSRWVRVGRDDVVGPLERADPAVEFVECRLRELLVPHVPLVDEVAGVGVEAGGEVHLFGDEEEEPLGRVQLRGEVRVVPGERAAVFVGASGE